MSVTIRPYLNKRKPKKDGTIPIYIRITKNRKSYYLSTGLSVKESEWDAAHREVKKSHRFAKKYNKEIKEKVWELEQNYFEIKDDNSVDPKSLKETVVNKTKDTLLNHAKAYREKLSKDKRFYEWKKFGTLVENLESFIREKDIRVDDIDSKFIEEFQSFLLDVVENNPKTTRRKLSTFKGFTDDLIKQEELGHDPFLNVKKVTANSSEKARLNFEQIQAIRSLELTENSALWHVRNYFMYSFLNAGIRFGDLCTLKWSNLIDGRLVYNMHKTGGGKSIKQMNEHFRILDCYQDGTEKPDDYIFPILRKRHTDPMELRREISSRNVIVNKHLKEIARLANIDATVSFHVARHSFSQYALKKGMDLYSISKALGHSDIETTQEYINSFDEDMLDSSMSKLFEEDS